MPAAARLPYTDLLSHLTRSVFPKDWDNFRERLGRRLGLDPSRVAALTEADFGEGGTMAAHGLELQLWASFRCVRACISASQVPFS